MTGSIEEHPHFAVSLRTASTELGLADYFEPLVLPLFSIPLRHWPSCCAGNCLPCARTLTAVALRTYELLEEKPQA